MGELFIDELERKILPFYRPHELNFDRYGVHGQMHVCRSVMVAEWMARFYRARMQTVIDFFAVRVAVAFHDSGRRANGVDLWESDSAANCVRYVVESVGDNDYAHGVGSLIEKKKKSADPLKKIVQDADVLEIMRPCCGHGGLAGFRRQFLHFGVRTTCWPAKFPIFPRNARLSFRRRGAGFYQPNHSKPFSLIHLLTCAIC